MLAYFFVFDIFRLNIPRITILYHRYRVIKIESIRSSRERDYNYSDLFKYLRIRVFNCRDTVATDVSIPSANSGVIISELANEIKIII